ncbi:hypothetical protein [Devosia sp. 2618]|uniref:hypothetical protein n=1 Tax=Devosia sp. 2618 TaxID=3156454 RepID=UPI0033958B9F
MSATATKGQMILATGYARDLIDAVYAASQQTEGSEAHSANIEKARNATARVAELLQCPDVAEQIRSAA